MSDSKKAYEEEDAERRANNKAVIERLASPKVRSLNESEPLFSLTGLVVERASFYEFEERVETATIKLQGFSESAGNGMATGCGITGELKIRVNSVGQLRALQVGQKVDLNVGGFKTLASMLVPNRGE